MRAPVALATAIFLALAGGAFAQTLYKWVDADGKTHYSNKPPMNFKGEVTQIPMDARPEPAAPRAVAPKAPRAETAEEEKPPPDAAARRRAVREQLEARLVAARLKLEQARKALSEGEAPGEGESQYVQQHLPRDARRPDRTPPPRSNCMSQLSSDGKAIWNCPRPVPGEAYYTRQEGLEEAVRRAEEELSDAERAYRRGVD